MNFATLTVIQLNKLKVEIIETDGLNKSLYHQLTTYELKSVFKVLVSFSKVIIVVPLWRK